MKKHLSKIINNKNVVKIKYIVSSVNHRLTSSENNNMALWTLLVDQLKYNQPCAKGSLIEARTILVNISC